MVTHAALAGLARAAEAPRPMIAGEVVRSFFSILIVLHHVSRHPDFPPIGAGALRLSPQNRRLVGGGGGACPPPRAAAGGGGGRGGPPGRRPPPPRRGGGAPQPLGRDRGPAGE